MWIRALLTILALGSFYSYLLYKETDLFSAFHLEAIVFLETNSSSSSVIDAETQHQTQQQFYLSCCEPFDNVTRKPICGMASSVINCTITCNDYKMNSNNDAEQRLFVKSLGNEAFFLETSYAPSLNYRQACSVESLAFNNPNLTIHVLMSTSDSIDDESNNSSTIAVLKRYPNIDIRTFDPAEAFLDSPLQQWYFCSDWFTGPYKVAHLADALRFVTLYKYGGYYFDLDIVTMRPLTEYRNFSAAESNGEVAIGAMHFDYKHPAIVDLVEEFRTSYNKDWWSHAGPGAITRVLKRYCGVEKIQDAFVDGAAPCVNFTIYRPRSFYPLHYSNWEGYFRNDSDTSARLLDEWKRNSNKNQSNDNNVLGAHVWNKLTADKPVFKHSGQLYSALAKEFCPLVYSIAPDTFKK